MSKTVLITGSSTGIGAAIARTLAPGNHIFVHYNRSIDAAQGVAVEVAELGGTASLVQADLSTESGTQALFDAVANQTDHLDVLINNAGSMLRRHSARELQWDFIDTLFKLNVISLMRLSTLCVPLLEEGTQPCIINITSIAMRNGAPTATVYAATKGAVDTFTRGLAKELAPTIRVNAIAPGVIATPFHEKVSTPEKMAAFAANVPLGRVGEAAHIAMTVPLLIENDYITGETIDVNGGLFMH